MLTVVPTRRFLKDAKLAGRRGLNILKLESVVSSLATGAELQTRMRDHALSGDWGGYRECHIEPDWLLIYKVEVNILRLVRTGTHSDLFAK